MVSAGSSHTAGAAPGTAGGIVQLGTRDPAGVVV